MLFLLRGAAPQTLRYSGQNDNSLQKLRCLAAQERVEVISKNAADSQRGECGLKPHVGLGGRSRLGPFPFCQLAVMTYLYAR
jgi:hypothetical protein